jgi:hypothetical protein
VAAGDPREGGRPALTQQPMHDALGIRRPGEPTPYEPALRRTVQVADLAGAYLPVRGMLFAERFQRAGSPGLHTYVEITPGPIGVEVLGILAGAGMQFSAFAGAGVANILAHSFANATFYYGRDGSRDTFEQTFGFTGQPELLTARTFHAGQVGPLILPEPPPAGASGVAHTQPLWFPQPLVFYGRQGFNFLTRSANQALDLSVFFRFPLEWRATPEVF